MSHWLEEVEHSHRKSKHHSGSMSRRIAEKKIAINNNYEKNKTAYEGFVQTLYKLVQRVNLLPEEMRELFGKLKAAPKKTKLNNHLNIFSSSCREQKFNFLSFFRLKPTHAKHIRVLYLYISKDEGFVTFEIKENYLIRKRLLKSGSESKRNGKKSRHSKERTHVIMKYAIAKLHEHTALEIIDWLAFRKQLQELTFWEEVPVEEKQFF